MKIETRPYPGSGGRAGGTRVIDSPLGVQVRIILGLRRIIPAEKLEEMSLQEAEALYQKTYGGVNSETESDLKEPTKRILRSLGVGVVDFGKFVNRPRQIKSSAQVNAIAKPNPENNDKSLGSEAGGRTENISTYQIIPKMKKRLFVDSMIRSLNKEKIDPFEDLYNDVAKENFRKVKLDHLLAGSSIPLLLATPETRTAITVGSMGAENYPLVRLEDHAPIISQLGINYVTSMLSTKNLSVLSGDTPAWIAENDENEDGAGSIEKISLTPYRISYTQPESRLLILQGGPGFDGLLKKKLMNGLTNQMLSTLFGVLERTAIRPQGMGFAITSGQTSAAAAAVPTFNSIMAMEEALDAIPVGKRAYITSTKGRRILASTQKEPGFPDSLLDGEGRINGWPCYVSNAVSQAAGSDAAGSLLLYGNWDELTLCQFGDFIVDIDPYSKAKNNQVMVTISGFFDWKSLRGTESTGSTEANEFKGFSTLAIK